MKSAEMFVKGKEDVTFRRFVGITLKNVIAMFWDTVIENKTKGVLAL